MAISLPIVSSFDNKGLKQAQGALGGLQKAVIGFGAVVAGAFAVKAVVDFGLGFIKAAEYADTANKRLEAVANATGVFGEETANVTKRLQEFADAQELVIAVEAEQIKAVQAQLLSFKSLSKSADEVGGNFDRATIAAFDLAEVMGISAQSASLQLAKALEDPVRGLTALRRSGTIFTEEQEKLIKSLVDSGNELEAQNIILSEIESQYGGTAEAAANASDKLELAFGQIQDAIGMALLPAFQGFTEYMIEDVIPPLTRFFEEDFPGILEAAGPIAEGFRSAMDDTAEALRQFLDIPENASLLEGLLDKIGEVQSNPEFQQFMGAIKDIIVEAAPVAGELAVSLGEIALALAPILKAAAEEAFPAVRNIATILGELAAITQILTGTLPQSAEAVEGYGFSWASTIPVIGGWIGPGGVLEKLATGLTTLREKLEEERDNIAAFFQNLVHAAEVFGRDLGATFEAIFVGIGEVFKEAWNNLWGISVEGLDMQQYELEERGPVLEAGAGAAMQMLFDGFVEKWPAIQTWFSERLDRIEEAFAGSGTLLVQIGRNIIDGLKRGLSDSWSSVANWVRDKVDWIKRSFAKALKIKSPSGVFYDYGQNIVQGLVNGLESISPKVDVAMGGITPMPMGGDFGSTSGGIIRGGGGVTVVVNAGMGTNGAEVGRQVVNAIRDYERRNGKVFATA